MMTHENFLEIQIKQLKELRKNTENKKIIAKIDKFITKWEGVLEEERNGENS